MKRVLFSLGFLGTWFAVSPLFSSDPKAPQAPTCPSCTASQSNKVACCTTKTGEEKQFTVTCVPNGSVQLTILANALASAEACCGSECADEKCCTEGDQCCQETKASVASKTITLSQEQYTEMMVEKAKMQVQLQALEHMMKERIGTYEIFMKTQKENFDKLAEVQAKAIRLETELAATKQASAQYESLAQALIKNAQLEGKLAAMQDLKDLVRHPAPYHSPSPYVASPISSAYYPSTIPPNVQPLYSNSTEYVPPTPSTCVPGGNCSANGAPCATCPTCPACPTCPSQAVPSTTTSKVRPMPVPFASSVYGYEQALLGTPASSHPSDVDVPVFSRTEPAEESLAPKTSEAK